MTRRLLLRAPKDPFEVVTPERMLDGNRIAGNSGNLIFITAAHRLLSRPDVTIDVDRLRIEPGDADRINERYDAYVIPLANAIRRSYEPQLLRMTALIRRLRIPVVILGIGAQANVRYATEPLGPIEKTVRAFASAVLDRSPSIGVRGELTHDYLAGLGFRDLEVIGCPSLFLDGARLHVEKRVPELTSDSRIALNVSPYVAAMGPIALRHAERYPNLVYLAQDIETLELLLWGRPHEAVPVDDPRPIHAAHPLFRTDRVRFFVDAWPWLGFLRGMDFSFGTRIHGNIAALMAGTPAVVLAHDSRTLELARYFEIPHRLMSTVPRAVDAAELYAEADFGPLQAGHPERWATFAGFLARHGLDHAFAAGGDPDAYTARLAATAYPPAIQVGHARGAGGPGGLLGRARRRLGRSARTRRALRIRVFLARLGQRRDPADRV